MAAISLVMQILPDGKHVKIGFDKFKYFPRVLISKLRIFDDNINAYVNAGERYFFHFIFYFIKMFSIRLTG